MFISPALEISRVAFFAAALNTGHNEMKSTENTGQLMYQHCGQLQVAVPWKPPLSNGIIHLRCCGNMT